MQDSIDDIEVRIGELGDHLVQQVRPLAWKVLLANVADGVTQLVFLKCSFYRKNI